MFLTLEDPNAKIKGSRDPLGTQPMWQKFGRHVVTNLTMQTNSVRGFTILLLGRYLTERLIEEGRLGRESAVDAFLRFEQIGAYVRHAAHGVGGGGIRGIERVRSNLQKHRGRVRVGSDPDQCILLDQRVTGLWGLFSASARQSGLLPDDLDPVGLTPEARAFVERACLQPLQPVMEPLLRLVERGGVLDTRAPDAVFGTLRDVLPETFTADEQQFYGEYVRDGAHVRKTPPGRQRRFRELLVRCTGPGIRMGRADVVRLCEEARSVDGELAEALDRIVRLEAVLAPAMALLDFLLTCHHRTLDDAARELAGRWSASVPNILPDRNRDLLPEIRSVAPETIPEHLDRCQQTLAGGTYQEALEALLAWHEDVMRARGGAPWVQVGEDGRLDVRYRGAERSLPSEEELPDLWWNDYFMTPLKAITRQLGDAA